jgi:hypothetical protein
VVDVRVEDPERAIAALRAEDVVASTTQLGDVVHVLLVEGADAEREADTLASRLADDGHEDARVTPSTANLEDVFVSILIDSPAEEAS